jgi:hypothetical protein
VEKACYILAIWVSHVYLMHPPFQEQPVYDVYVSYPHSYPTAEQVSKHEEVRKFSDEPYPYKYPYKYPTAHDEAIKKIKECSVKEAKDHPWE